MSPERRLDQVVALVEEHGFVSVKDLSRWLNVSEVTIRRDLKQLDEEKRLRKTYGGGVSLRRSETRAAEGELAKAQTASPTETLTDRVDVLITTLLDTQTDQAFIDRANNKDIPVIAESTDINGTITVVAVDNYEAGKALGAWVGAFASEHFGGTANVLDLTYALSNTEARSQGFITGLTQVLPNAQVIVSLNAQSRSQMACQLATDALNVHPNINIIFAINDATGWGAIRACQDLELNPDSLLLVTFGLEGNTMKDALTQGTTGFCKAGLAMFPEIVAPICIEAAIDAYNNKPLPKQIVTPYAIVTTDTLPQYYRRTEFGWQIEWDSVKAKLKIPFKIAHGGSRPDVTLPTRVGFVVPFVEHEWYKNLTAFMKQYADSLGIQYEAADVVQTIKDDVILRQRAIAKMAAGLVHPGDVVSIDGSEITTFLAEELAALENITVITNAIPVFDVLKECPKITLISTGGSLRRASGVLAGPTAEAALRELRADMLFLSVTGISLGFGLSHNNVGEVAVKQAMMRAAREVILLADHTKFGQESVIQIVPATAINKLITDNALSPMIRLELSKLGIEIMTAKT